jgi:acetyl-CoA carboxylase, biotin carboxylase subunit
MFSKILVANRGEIAIRILRAARELGIKTVAIYSEADKNSLHLALADEAICIGKGPAAESYLNISSIISAAEVTDADAIHPGYGFLAENPHFAEICHSCGIKFIGPSAENIRLMGDKIQAKKTMKKAGVPLIPGSDGKVTTKEEVIEITKKIGFPVILKAKSGGGGKGMRICHSEISLAASLHTAQTEAGAAFGDSGLYVEKYLENPRHIEIQIAADSHGNMIHLGERDCSIQRNHQKIIEEAPSPIIDSHTRKKMGQYALRGVKEINYQSVGTVEFLLDKNGEFYFMEMNTRIQVEHTITEEVTGVDLLKLQILIAAGKKLTLKQSDIKVKGHAIECRLNAEDPEKNFMPSPGKIDFCYFPGGKDIRVDTHIYSGYHIPPYYDSLIAKIIAKGKNRKDAIKKMNRALMEFMIEPIKTTAQFCLKAINNSDFITGKYNTGFIKKIMDKQ